VTATMIPAVQSALDDRCSHRPTPTVAAIGSTKKRRLSGSSPRLPMIGRNKRSAVAERANASATETTGAKIAVYTKVRRELTSASDRDVVDDHIDDKRDDRQDNEDDGRCGHLTKPPT